MGIQECDVMCPWCRVVSKLSVWDDVTFSECINREMKRSYMSLRDTNAWKHGSNHFYKCPSCEQWSRGSKLKIVHTEDKELEALGGESLLNVE